VDAFGCSDKVPGGDQVAATAAANMSRDRPSCRSSASAAVEAEAGLRIAGQFGTAGVTPPPLAILAQIALRRGHSAAALDYLCRAQRHMRDGIGVIAEELTWKLALCQDTAGRPEQARARHKRRFRRVAEFSAQRIT
jgi:hypothetical protein